MAEDASASNAHWLQNIMQLQEDVRPLFQVDNEVSEIYGQIASSLQRTEEARTTELNDMRERLRALSRQAEAYKLATLRPATAQTSQQHEAKLVELDTKKFGIAKTIADLEQAITSTEVSIGRHRDAAATLEKLDPLAEKNAMGTGSALRLYLYREAGFVPVAEEGRYTRLLVKSDTHHDVHSFDTEAAPSRYEMASQIWAAASNA